MTLSLSMPPQTLKEARMSFYIEGGLIRVNKIPRATNAWQCVASNVQAMRLVNNSGGHN